MNNIFEENQSIPEQEEEFIINLHNKDENIQKSDELSTNDVEIDKKNTDTEDDKNVLS